MELRAAVAVQNANRSHAMWQAFWGEEAGFRFPSSKYPKATGPGCHMVLQLCPKAPTESNDSMNLAVTEGFIKAVLTLDLRKIRLSCREMSKTFGLK